MAQSRETRRAGGHAFFGSALLIGCWTFANFGSVSIIFQLATIDPELRFGIRAVRSLWAS